MTTPRAKKHTMTREELASIRSLIDYMVDEYSPVTNDVNIRRLISYATEMCTLLEKLYDYLGITE